jgi:hypothetical protein
MFAKANVGWQVIVCLAVVSGVTGCVSQEQAAGEQMRADLYRQISVLESQRQSLADKMQQQRSSLRQMTEEGGAVDLDNRVQMRMQRVAALMKELIEIETKRAKLESEIEVLDRMQQKKPEDIDKLAQKRGELDVTSGYEKRVRDILAKEDAEAVELGKKKVAIADLKEQIELTRQAHENVSRRIEELKKQEQALTKK